MNRQGRPVSRAAQLGDWLLRHSALIRRVQWALVLVYLVLILVPPMLALPNETATVFNHLTTLAQWLFWGIWWPFVLLSMVLMGRVWCGVLCPEGFLSEWASRHGRQHSIPRWMRWPGWPFVAFVTTTVYGQMVSVYQYPKAVLLVLGGSTVAAVLVGYWYGREKRVWCRYLCPVSGVFGLLAKLAPWHFRVDAQAWQASHANLQRVVAVNCAPLVAIRKMEGASECHMCGRCSGHRQAVQLQWRPRSQEVAALGARDATGWQTVLLLLGVFGVALGAFQWTVSPLWVHAKQAAAEWLVAHDIWWPLSEDAPWWLLTHYPAQRDVFSWLDGAMLLAYIAGVTLLMSGALATCVAAATRACGPWVRQRFHHLAQTLVPLGACSLFLGLSAMTVSLLRSEGVGVGWANPVRGLLLAAASAWCLQLAWLATGQHTRDWRRRSAATLLLMPALALVNAAWWLQFAIW